MLIGYALGGTSLAETDLKPYIQQAIDQVRKYTMLRVFKFDGDIAIIIPDQLRHWGPLDQRTRYCFSSCFHLSKFSPDYLWDGTAALRASLGHPEPFKLRFVEIGNEVRVLSIWRADHFRRSNHTS